MQYWKVLSYAILESTFFWSSAPPFCFASARCINFCFASARCINFYRHFWDVFGCVGQHVTLSVTARPLIWLREELCDSKFSFWWGLKAYPHCTTDPDLTSQITSDCTIDPNRTGSTEATLGGGFEPGWANYARACTLLPDI